MEHLKKSYIGAAVFFDRVADDGWPDDAGWWPERIGKSNLHAADGSQEPIQGVRRSSIARPVDFVLLRNRNRT